MYTYSYFAQTNIDDRLNGYSLWIANYGVNTPQSNPIWNSWVGFQYSDKGKVSGISGDVDLDEFTSGILMSGTTPPVTNPTEPETGYYIIQSGDTLSGIAGKFGTTTSRLASINGILNPNKIYAGQTLKIS